MDTVVAEPSSEALPTEEEHAVEPFAVVGGKPLRELPQDLYIPPDALEVFLDTFHGPLDLLLYLIKRQNLDILDIPVAKITEQYMQYVDLMKQVRLELAGEYLVMAAMLAEIKSRMLLPRPVSEEGDELDPRAELIRRLQEYERFKQAAEDLDELPRQDREIHQAQAAPPEIEIKKVDPEVELKELLVAFAGVMKRIDVSAHHQITKEALSIRDKMTHILSILKEHSFVPFQGLFTIDEGRLGVVVSFMAILELLKQASIEMVQTEVFGPIHVKAIYYE